MYTFGNISFNTFGVIPARSGDSNIALSGCFDLPERVGETSHDWADQDGIEPYVDQDEMFFSGRDITLNALVLGSKSFTYEKIQQLRVLLEAFTTVQVLSTPYGIFNTVYFKKATVAQYSTVSEIKFEFREVNPTLTYGMLPSVGVSENTFDGIPFDKFGLYIASTMDKATIPDLKTAVYTSYLVERFKKTRHKEKIMQINGFIIANDVDTFLDKVFALQLLFSSPGLRKVKFNNNLEVDCFAKDGFKVTNVNLSGKMIANFSINLTMVNEKALYLLAAHNGKSILTFSGNLILI